MNRLVYLCELDSVRDKELDKKNGVLMTDAFNAICYEIIKNGNSVAVTMNQLTDSCFFAQVFNDDYAYESVLKLFELGALRVSIYRDQNNDIRTASQYVQNALTGFKDAGSRFVFSNFPLKGEDSDEFKETVFNALRYSDLSKLNEMLRESKGKDDELAERLEIIIRFVNIVLMLSVCETANISPKCDDCGDLAEKNADETYSFVRFMHEILRVLGKMKDDGECAEFYGEHRDEIELAFGSLNSRMEAMKGRNDVYKRSAWLYENNVKLFSGLSEEIIHICYNYTVEDSINGVCEHFDNKNIKDDLYLKLIDYYEREKKPVLSAFKKVKKGRFKTMIRFAEYREKQKIDYNGIYAGVFRRDRFKWKLFMARKSLIAFFWALVYIGMFCGVEIVNSFLEDTFSLSMPNQFLTALLNVVIFGILGSIIGILCKLINRNREVPDILDSLFDIFVHIFDLFVVIIGGKNGSQKLS